jgi:hypothetical protein
MAIPFFRNLMQDPRVTVVHDDARRWLLRSMSRFDLILMDPLRTASAMSNNIYSKEFFAIIKRHLSSAGVAMIWIDDYQVLPATVVSAFPAVYYDCWHLIAGNQFGPDADRSARYEKLLDLLPYEISAAIRSVVCQKHGTKPDILASTQGVEVNTDYRPVTEYYIRKLFSSLSIR